MVDDGSDPLAATAMSSPPPARAGDTLAESVERVESAATVDSHEIVPGARALHLETVERDLYTERQLLAEGGMGKIVLARDARLGRRVALKELRIDSAAARARFEREAALTARLEHPGIVGIHEAGRWPSGEPFFAMRVIAGRSLDKLLSERTERTARLALLPNVLAVADAIAYAHEQRIIHRDLKPHNVMIGEFGETVVIDWGLAKELGTEELAVPEQGAASGSLTVAGSVIGTPMYLPPEQARGEEVDATADVYAIGAILYELLAGSQPYTARTVEELLEKVVEGPPPPLPGDLPAELVAIVARAMAREREDRYPSARELADDLRKFQTGQLVGAHRYTTRQLVARWIRRNKGILATAAIAVVVLAVLGAWSIRRIMSERAEARRRGEEAVAARTRAEQLVDFMQQDLRTQLEAINKLELLEPAARKVIEYREQALDGSDAAQLALANGYKHLGDSQLSRGDFAGARATVEAGLATLAKVAAPSAAVRRDVSVLTNTLGDIAVLQGDSKGSLPRYRAALAIVEQLAAADPANTQYLIDIEFTQGKISDALMLAGDTRGALAAVRAGAAVIEKLPPPADEGMRKRLASARAKVAVRVGELLGRTGDSKAALAELLHAKQLAQEIAATDPNWRAQRDVGVALDRIAKVRIASGDPKAARVDLEESLAISTRLSAQDPANAVLERDVVVNNNQLADLLTKLGDHAAARTYGEAGLAAAERAAKRSPSNARATADLAASYDRLAAIDAALDRIDSAVELAARARTLRTKLVEQDPKNTEWRRGLETSHYRTARVLRSAKRYAEARTEAETALALARQISAANPSDTGALRDVSVMENTLAGVLGKLGDRAGALAHYRADLAVAEALAATDPTNKKWQLDLAESHRTVGEQLAESGDRAGARASFETALAILAKLGPAGEEMTKEVVAARAKLGR